MAPVGEVDRDSLCQPPTRSSPVPARDDAGPLPDVVALRSQPPRHGIRDRLNRWIPTFAGVTACDDRRWPRHPLTRGSPPARIIASMNERAGLCGQSNHPGPCPNTNLGRGGTALRSGVAGALRGAAAGGCVAGRDNGYEHPQPVCELRCGRKAAQADNLAPALTGVPIGKPDVRGGRHQHRAIVDEGPKSRGGRREPPSEQAHPLLLRAENPSRCGRRLGLGPREDDAGERVGSVDGRRTLDRVLQSEHRVALCFQLRRGMADPSGSVVRPCKRSCSSPTAHRNAPLPIAKTIPAIAHGHGLRTCSVAHAARVLTTITPVQISPNPLPSSSGIAPLDNKAGYPAPR